MSCLFEASLGKNPDEFLKQSTNIQFHFHPNTQSSCYLQSTVYKPRCRKKNVFQWIKNRIQCV